MASSAVAELNGVFRNTFTQAERSIEAGATTFNTTFEKIKLLMKNVQLKNKKLHFTLGPILLASPVFYN